MTRAAPFSCSIDAFEGPLDLLIQLIQKEEVDIHSVPVLNIINQFANFLFSSEDEELNLEVGAESLALFGAIMLYKSRHLLPKYQVDEEEEALFHPFESASALVDYIRFKMAGQQIKDCIEYQSQRFRRSPSIPKLPPPPPRPLTPIDTDEFRDLFQNLLESIPRAPITSIEGETWVVSDKIIMIRSLIGEKVTFSLYEIFLPLRPLEEYIVTFLALLELMKQGEIAIVKEEGTSNLFVQRAMHDYGE